VDASAAAAIVVEGFPRVAPGGQRPADGRFGSLAGGVAQHGPSVPGTSDKKPRVRDTGLPISPALPFAASGVIPTWHAGRVARRAKSSAAKGPPTLQRNVQFFRANAGLTKAGRPLPLEIEPILDRLDRLVCREGERYVVQDDGNVVSSWVDSVTDRPRFRLATVRRTGLPLVESAGALSALPLEANQGLYEAIHVVFFPRNVVGVEFNFYGPRPSRVPWYLSRATKGQFSAFTLDPLLRQDVLQQLNRLAQVRVLDLAIRPSYAATVAEADRDLGSAFRAAAKAGGSELVQLTLRPAPHGRTWLAAPVLQAVRQLAGRSDVRENAQTFTVKGLNAQTESIELIDVLKDQLIAHKQIVRLDTRSRAVDDAAAYQAIEEAYTELHSDLEAAAAAMGR